MGFASIIATALGIILLIVTAYVLVSGVLVASETVVAAQKDMTAIQVKMLGTSLEITEATDNMTIVTNTGSEPIRHFENMDLFIKDGSGWDLYRYNMDWTADKTYVNPGKNVVITHSIKSPYEVKIVTPNGISAYNKTPNYP
jgi:flagellar protein FlaF